MKKKIPLTEDPAFERLNIEEGLWDHYSGLPSPEAYRKRKEEKDEQ